MKKISTLILLLSFSTTAVAQTKATVNSNIKAQGSADSEARNSQKKIDKLDDQTNSLTMKYRNTLRRIENARIYNDQLKKIIKQQLEEEVSVKHQITELEETDKGIVPLILRMVDTFEQFVKLDTPFLQKERMKRIADLRKMMDRADVTTSEKFRRTLEAYQIENEYGRTIEAYRGIEKVDGKELTVDYLRIGRIGLVYQSLDAATTALWDSSSKKWVELGSEFKNSVREGLRMARKQAAPQLLKLPIMKIGSAQ